jgi:uncharacterized RDD family membrane protein YckC
VPQAVGFWMRACARVIDWVVLAVVGIGVSILLAAIAGIVRGVSGWESDAFVDSLFRDNWVIRIASVLEQIVYHSVCEGLGGATIGKRLLGIQVVSVDLTRCRPGQAIKRSVGFLADALFLAAIGAVHMHESPIKQRLGDKWADTRVVRRDTLPLPVRVSGLQVLAASLFGMLAAATISAAVKVLNYVWL